MDGPCTMWIISFVVLLLANILAGITNHKVNNLNKILLAENKRLWTKINLPGYKGGIT